MRIWLQNKINLLTFILLVFYLVGFLGMFLYPHIFSKLTPYNMILTAILLFSAHPEKDFLFYINLVLVFMSAWFLEMIGVSTGSIFGNYKYGEALGLKISETPIIIGLNWVIVTYAGIYIANQIGVYLKLKLHEILGALLSALSMVLLDLLIEPLAPRLDFWYWDLNLIPLQNYTAWFFFGFAFSYWMLKAGLLKNNPMGVRVYLVQLGFFGMLNLIA